MVEAVGVGICPVFEGDRRNWLQKREWRLGIGLGWGLDRGEK